MTTRYDFLAIGEALVDLISDDRVDSLAQASNFSRYAGGQAANLAATMARLSRRAALAACVGDDGLGRYFRRQLENSGTDSHLLEISNQNATTIAIVSRQSRTPEFIIYRGADSQLFPSQALLDATGSSAIVHTSAFALARDPARSTILACIRHAAEAGALITLDPNYHPRVWPDTDNFRSVLKEAFQQVGLTKPSLDDCERIFGPGHLPDAYADAFLEWGARTVVLTMGAAGILVRTASGFRAEIPVRPAPVLDVTGAGDAFWAGYLLGYLAQADPLLSACLGQVVAEIKLATVGPVQDLPVFDELLASAAVIQKTAIVSAGQ